MVDQKKLGEFWNSSVPKEFKHFQDTSFDQKTAQYYEKIQTLLVSKIDFSQIKTAIDWGCGGGMFSLDLAKRNCSVIPVDISEESLNTCKNRLVANGLSTLNTYKIEDIDQLEIKETVDLLFSVSVIQHFPSVEYWQSVAKKWNSISPKTIAIQTRHGSKDQANPEQYFDSVKNYILGLRLETETVKNSFQDRYQLSYHFFDQDNHSDYEYFIFQRKS